jgi:uncharacterized protein
MWMVMLTFDDNPGRLALRPAHRERLTALHAQGRVRMAGPYADGTGALIVFDTPDRATLDALIAEDPYYAAPGVGVEIREWATIIP